MDTLKITYLNNQDKNLKLTFEALSKLPFNVIDTINWQNNYSYTPLTHFQIAWNEAGLYLRFVVTEEHLLANNTQITGNVWEDSCVEFFFSPYSNNQYFNLELNAIGSRLLGYSIGTQRQRTTEENLKNIIIHSSMPLHKPLNIKSKFSWSVNVFLPVNLICIDGENWLKANHIFKANFYKCGDKTKEPHYVSWAAINYPNPNFHLPQFFGTCQLIHL